MKRNHRTRVVALVSLCLCALLLAAVPACAQRGAAGPAGAQQPVSHPVISQPASAPADANAPSVTLRILHVNDVHGQTLSQTYLGESTGGYARLATLLARFRSEGDANLVLFLHAGDEFSRGDEVTSRTHGAANVRILNFLRLDAWTPGNGDFYEGPGLLSRMREANFPSLAANVSPAGDGNWPAQPYIIRRVGPVKVAIFGLCTVYADRPGGEIFRAADAFETAARLVPELRKKADVVIALTHIGYTEDLRLIAKVPGIDAVIGGHSHTVLGKGEFHKGPTGERVLLCQAGEQLRYLGCADLTLKQFGGKWQVVSSRAQLVPLNSKAPEDPTVKALLARLWSAASQPASAPVSVPVSH